jgi:hypothetical protein
MRENRKPEVNENMTRPGKSYSAQYKGRTMMYVLSAAFMVIKD